MSSSKTIRLADCVGTSGIFTDGDWIESKDQDPLGSVRLIQMADIGVGFYKNKSSRFLTEEKFIELRCTELLSGDILISRMPDPIGRACIFPGDPLKCATVVDIAVLRVDPDIVSAKWLVYCINSNLTRQKIEAFATGTTRQRISGKNLKNIPISLPPLSEQQRIVARLDKARQLIDQRKEQLALMDDLIQSIFYEMFGDPVENPKNFPVKNLPEFYVSEKDGTRCGPFGSTLKKDEFVSNGIPVWNMDNISLSGRMISPFRMWVTEAKYKELSAFSVQHGDIIISRAGTVGKMCVANMGSERSLISTNLIRLRLNKDLLPLYFVSLMHFCKGRVGRLKTGADGSFTHMNTGVLDTLFFPAPPLPLQQTFADHVQQIEALKQTMTASLKEMEQNFQALMQEAFGG